MKRRALFVLIALVALCFTQAANTPPAQACRCFRSTPADTFQRADAVFSGKVVSVKEQKRPAKNGDSHVTHAYTFEVRNSWKGVSSSRITTYFYSYFLTDSGTYVTGCHSEGFKVGETYLVYARRGDGPPGFPDLHDELGAGLSYCGRSALLSAAYEDLQALGPGTVHSQPVPAWGSGPFSMLNVFGWIGSLFAWLLGLLR